MAGALVAAALSVASREGRLSRSYHMLLILLISFHAWPGVSLFSFLLLVYGHGVKCSLGANQWHVLAYALEI